MAIRLWRCSIVLGIAYSLYSPAAVNAKIILITHGETISHIGEIVPQFRDNKFPGLKVGFRYSYGGIFWLDMWTWGGEFCVYQGDRYQDISRSQAAELLGQSVGDVSKPFFYRFPPGLCIIVAIVAIGIVVAVWRKQKSNRVGALFDDARYQRALDIMRERTKQLAEAFPIDPNEPAEEQERKSREQYRDAFEAGVQDLVDCGIDRAIAAENLALLVQRLMAAQAQMQ